MIIERNKNVKAYFGHSHISRIENKITKKQSRIIDTLESYVVYHKFYNFCLI